MSINRYVSVIIVLLFSFAANRVRKLAGGVANNSILSVMRGFFPRGKAFGIVYCQLYGVAGCLSPLFWSGRDFGPGDQNPQGYWSPDQHPQESALVIMVRVGDCGPGAWGTSFGVP